MSMSNLKHPLCVAKNGSASVGKFRMGSETFNLRIRGTRKAEFARANLGVIFWWLAWFARCDRDEAGRHQRYPALKPPRRNTCGKASTRMVAPRHR
jgi:hypothetical protein